MNKLLWISFIVTALLVDQGKGSIPLPFQEFFPEGLNGGRVLEIHGNLEITSSRHIINIQRYSCSNPDGDYDVAMHMVMDFYGFDFSHKEGGLFGQKEHVYYPHSFGYKIKIVIFYDRAVIYSSGDFLYEFKYRTDISDNSNYLCIYGPTSLDYIDFSQLS